MKRRNSRAHCSIGGSRKNNIGYCKLHRCNVTLKQMKNRKCLTKACKHFRRHEGHPYWQKRKEIEESKRIKKELQNAYFAERES